jgi:WD40 repeat protein
LLRSVKFRDTVEDVEFSPDGRLLAVAHGLNDDYSYRYRIAIYRPSDLMLLAELKPVWVSYWFPNKISFLPVGRELVIARVNGNSSILWNWFRGTTKNLPSAYGVAANPEGTQIALSGHGTTTLLNLPSGAFVGSLRSNPNLYPVGPVSYVWSGRLLAIMRGNAVEVWDPQRRQRVRTIRYREHFTDCWALAARPNTSQFAVACRAGKIYLFEAQTGTLVHKFNFSTNIYDVAFSPDGRAMVAPVLYDGSPMIFDLDVLLKRDASSTATAYD